MTAVGAGVPVAPARPHVSTRQAAFIGVGAMVGAGIFSLLGTAGEVAGSAVWISFVLAGGIAALQGYSFAKFGARFPSAAGCSSTSTRVRGGPRRDGHRVAGVRREQHRHRDGRGVRSAATPLASSPTGTPLGQGVRGHRGRAMTGLNVAGSTFVARVQSLIVFVVVGILGFFAVVTIANMHPSLLAPSTYPGVQDIVSSVALTFFAFLGFGVVTFTAKDLAEPAKQLPRAMAIAIGLATASTSRCRSACSGR